MYYFTTSVYTLYSKNLLYTLYVLYSSMVRPEGLEPPTNGL